MAQATGGIGSMWHTARTMASLSSRRCNCRAGPQEAAAQWRHPRHTHGTLLLKLDVQRSGWWAPVCCAGSAYSPVIPGFPNIAASDNPLPSVSDLLRGLCAHLTSSKGSHGVCRPQPPLQLPELARLQHSSLQVSSVSVVAPGTQPGLLSRHWHTGPICRSFPLTVLFVTLGACTGQPSTGPRLLAHATDVGGLH